MRDVEAGWEEALTDWLRPFMAVLGHKARRQWAPVYIRGLLGPSERKSLQPMAAHLSPAEYDRLHHFIASPAWDAGPLATVLAREADRLVGGAEAVLVIDDTALPKKGKHSVGVAHQYAGTLGKNANCQVLVSLTLARNEVPVPVALRLFLPKEWAEDPARLERAGVPEALRFQRTKTEIALEELDRLITAGVRFRIVLADAGYGLSADFRQGLSERGLLWAVGILRTQKAYSLAVELLWPTAPVGRPRQVPVPSEEPRAAEDILAGVAWQRLSWRRGTKGPLTAEFAAVRVRIADGPLTRPSRHLPGEEVWLVGERRASGEHKYYLANLPPDTPLETLARMIKARWVCEQAHQQLKEELGLDHFEGRSWPGLYRHALLAMIAFAFLQHLRLERVKRGEKPDRSAAAAHPAGGPARPAGSPRRHTPAALPHMPLLDQSPPP